MTCHNSIPFLHCLTGILLSVACLLILFRTETQNLIVVQLSENYLEWFYPRSICFAFSSLLWPTVVLSGENVRLWFVKCGLYLLEAGDKYTIDRSSLCNRHKLFIRHERVHLMDAGKGYAQRLWRFVATGMVWENEVKYARCEFWEWLDGVAARTASLQCFCYDISIVNIGGPLPLVVISKVCVTPWSVEDGIPNLSTLGLIGEDEEMDISEEML